MTMAFIEIVTCLWHRNMRSDAGSYKVDVARSTNANTLNVCTSARAFAYLHHVTAGIRTPAQTIICIMY